MNEKVWWYLSRSSGIIALVLLVLSVVWGVLLATRALKPHDRPAWPGRVAAPRNASRPLDRCARARPAEAACAPGVLNRKLPGSRSKRAGKPRVSRLWRSKVKMPAASVPAAPWR